MASSQIASHVVAMDDGQVAELMYDIEHILRSGELILGRWTERFEREFAEKCGRAYGVAVSSDTAAFEILLRVLDVRDKPVLFPALAFPSILQSVINAGGEPWFFDASIEGHLFATVDEIERVILDCRGASGQVPAALILMHTGGLIARDSAAIVEVCEQYGVPVLEDAAHAYGAELAGAPAGSFGRASAFSLYATKPMHACEGGMIVTDDERIASEAKIYRNYGRGQNFGRSEIIREGYSWRITEIQSAIGCSNLARMDANVARRREIMAIYDRLISAHGDVWSKIDALPLHPEMKPNGYRYIRLLPSGWDRDRRLVFKEHVKTTTGIDLPGEVYELPTHHQPTIKDWSEGITMPVSEDFCGRHFALPVYPSLRDADLGYVVDEVGSVLRSWV